MVSVCCKHDRCALITQNGLIYVWGSGKYGALGLGSNADVEAPTFLPLTNAENGDYEYLRGTICFFLLLSYLLFLLMRILPFYLSIIIKKNLFKKTITMMNYLEI